jgi:hypothetical protein
MTDNGISRKDATSVQSYPKNLKKAVHNKIEEK